MNEHPILFSGEMVRAILDGKKTQTRRIIKPQPLDWCTRFEQAPFKLDGATVGKQGDWLQMTQDAVSIRGLGKCHYGQSGDGLWVRETFVLEQDDLEGDEPVIPTDRPHFHHPGGENEFDAEYYLFPHYRATDPTPELMYDDMDEPGCRWRPSIHMPRWASRITLEVVNVRVERVQAISYADARAEGMYCGFSGGYDFNIGPVGAYQANFRRLWDQLNKGRGFGWDVNPWVWVIELKKVES